MAIAQDPIITPHPVYTALGADQGSRAAAYRTWLHAPLDEDGLPRIRAHMAQEEALGESRFQAMGEKALNRPATVRPRGRPRREALATGVKG